MSSHFLPDVIVAEEAAHFSFGKCASRERVIVVGKQVDTQDLNVTAVQSTAVKQQIKVVRNQVNL